MQLSFHWQRRSNCYDLNEDSDWNCDGNGIHACQYFSQELYHNDEAEKWEKEHRYYLKDSFLSYLELNSVLTITVIISHDILLNCWNGEYQC